MPPPHSRPGPCAPQARRRPRPACESTARQPPPPWLFPVQENRCSTREHHRRLKHPRRPSRYVSAPLIHCSESSPSSFGKSSSPHICQFVFGMDACCCRPAAVAGLKLLLPSDPSLTLFLYQADVCNATTVIKISYPSTHFYRTTGFFIFFR